MQRSMCVSDQECFVWKILAALIFVSCDYDLEEVASIEQEQVACKPIVVEPSSVVAGQDDGNAPQNVVDRSLSTRWSNPGTSSWIRLDLGEEHTVCTISIAWYRGKERRTRFRILMSPDVKNWTEIYRGESSGSGTELESYDVTNNIGRYVKIGIYGLDAQDVVGITEVKVFGSNFGFSSLYGPAGELWDPRGRLPDFSYAGYHMGNDPIPEDLPVVGNVKDFGAKGDGVTDDTASFRAALNGVSDGVLLIPKGDYVISQIIRIRKSNIVLRGEGSRAGQTTLKFVKPICAISQLGCGYSVIGGSHRPKSAVSPWSWKGGLIEVLTDKPNKWVTSVVSPAKRGATVLEVADASALRPGMVIQVRLEEIPTHTLWRVAMNGQVGFPRFHGCDPTDAIDLIQKIAAVEGNQITLAQPLLMEVRLQWNPTILRMPVVREVGIEHLRIRFNAETEYHGHLHERGHNAIEFSRNVIDSWIDDVQVQNSDSAVFISGESAWNTVRRLRVTGREGHHGVCISRGQNNLVTRFFFASEFVHELSVSHQAVGNVFEDGSGDVPIDMDHHRDWPFQNLFTNISSPARFAGTTGSACSGPSSGARGTFWNVNIRGEPPPVWGFIQTNVIGPLTPLFPESKLQTIDREWYENVRFLKPANLRTSQLAFRRQKQ